MVERRKSEKEVKNDVIKLILELNLCVVVLFSSFLPLFLSKNLHKTLLSHSGRLCSLYRYPKIDFHKSGNEIRKPEIRAQKNTMWLDSYVECSRIEQ